ncbi:MAG: hypothetical protein JST12_04355 [Armatimonadetes bacterium]|nr:hypothetical protein [Armatimonadota bacterium]MBS1700871.1 hypothetical protein [Armatimonadota bacterium]MBS1726508.1 hypothetical protein [Armatimonadota bacterium]
MKQEKNSEGPPCKHMENLLQGVADGSVRGIRKAFVLFHVTHCSHCGNFLKRLKTMLSVMHDTKQDLPPTEAMERLRAKIRELDSETPQS